MWIVDFWKTRRNTNLEKIQVPAHEKAAMICLVLAEGSINCVAHSIQMFLPLILSKSFLFVLYAFDACLFQSFAQSHDIRNQNFVSLHSGFIIIDFDEAAGMQCWHYFSYTYFWFGHLVGVTCSSSVLLRIHPYLFLAQFDSSVYIRIQSGDNDHVISYMAVLIVVNIQYLTSLAQV